MSFRKYLEFILLCLLCTSAVQAQQLKLGKNPSVNLKSAVLELQSDNQGLLMVRIADTSLINTLTPPDGMVIYFTPTKQLLVRSGGYWQSVVQALPVTGASGYILQANGTGNTPTWVDPSIYIGNSAWSLSGNSLSAIKKLGTTTNYDLPFITNNTEQMRLSTAGNLGLGASSFDGTNPEKLLVQAGTTSSVNALVARGTINKYFQINIQNQSTGTSASSDIVATANNGTESSNYVDLGINGQNFASSGDASSSNDGYLISSGNDFYIINNNAAKDIITLTGGMATANEAMRVTSSGKIGMGTTTPAAKLDVNSTYKLGNTGTVNKNQISFSSVLATTAIAASTMSVVLPNSYTPAIKDVTFNIPTTNLPATSQGTVIVSPNFDLPGTVSIAFVRLISNTQVRVRFINASTTAQNIAGTFYFTITEF